MKGRKVYGNNGRPDTYYIDGAEVTKEVYEDAFPDKPLDLSHAAEGSRPWCRAIESDGAAVHPRQIKAAMERNRKHGLHIDYNPQDGRPIFKDRDQRRRLLRIEGFRDNDGGYSD